MSASYISVYALVGHYSSWSFKIIFGYSYNSEDGEYLPHNIHIYLISLSNLFRECLIADLEIFLCNVGNFLIVDYYDLVLESWGSGERG
jgi:hypothetical protein